MIKLTTEGVMENLYAHHIYYGIIIIKPAHTMSTNSPITNNLSAILNSHKKIETIIPWSINREFKIPQQ